MNIVLSSNFVTVCLILGMGVLTVTNRTFDKRTNRLFSIFIIIVSLLDLSDMLDYYLSFSSEPVVWRYVSSAVGYMARPASLAIIINILLRRKQTNIAAWIPAIFVGVLAVTSSFTHLMFWFDDGNQFVRGPLGYLSHIVSACYMLLLIVLTVKMYHRIDFGEVMIIVYIAVICVLAVIIESECDLKFLLPGTMAVSCAMYYILLYVQTYNRDVLTGLLNRRRFYLDAEKYSHQSLAVISMDLNGLKDINDSKGHQAGDLALSVFADTLIRVAGKDYSLYRTGGDEFFALGKKKSLEEAEEFIKNSQEELKKTGYMASFGCAVYQEMDNFDEICNQADALMYKDKRNYKHRTKSRNEQ